MPASSAALLREHITDQDAAAAICFQSAGQVVTVLGKIDRHFKDDAVAIFAKQAVAEYAAKQDAQLVAVTVMEGSGADAPVDAHHFTQGDKHYAITVGNLADERTRMDHLTRVMERLKYLQAVMVMLSTTDMLGTSETLGKHMGGMTARLQQVQKLGVQLEKLTLKIEDAKKRNQPLSQKVFEKHLKTLMTQLQKVQLGAPPELRRVLQAMIAQVKEMRQWPAFTAPQRAPVSQLKVVAKQDGVTKTQHRFKTQPAKLQLAKLQLKGVDGMRVAAQIPSRTAARIVSMTSFRASPAALQRILARITPANDNRFRVANSLPARIVANNSRSLAVQTPAVKQGIAVRPQSRFSVLSALSKTPVAITRMAAVAIMAVSAMVAHASPTKFVPSSAQSSGVVQSRVVAGQTLAQNSVSQPVAAVQAAPIAQVNQAANVTANITANLTQNNPAQTSVQAASPVPSQTNSINTTVESARPAVSEQRAQPIENRAELKSAEIRQPEIKQPEIKQPDANKVEARIEPKSDSINVATVSQAAKIEVRSQETQQETRAVSPQKSLPAQSEISVTASVAAPRSEAPAQVASVTTALPHNAQTLAAQVVQPPQVPQAQVPHAQVPQAQVPQAQPPIIEQYKQAAQDLGERVVRGAQEFTSNIKQHVDAIRENAVERVTNIAARTVPDIQNLTDKVNLTIGATYQAAADAACRARCAALAAASKNSIVVSALNSVGIKMPDNCTWCNRPTSQAVIAQQNKFLAIPSKA